MKNVVISVSFVLLLSLTQTFAASDISKQSANCPEFSESQIQNSLDHILLAKRGCCSWHQGVCGCSGSRQLCCDGTLSPTCMCGERGGKRLNDTRDFFEGKKL